VTTDKQHSLTEKQLALNTKSALSIY